MKRNTEAAILDNELRNTQHPKLEKSSIEGSLFEAIDNNDIVKKDS